MATVLEDVYPAIGRRIQQKRRECELTQEQIGRLLVPPVTRASVANIETGKQRLLVHTWLQLAAIFDVGPEALLPPSEVSGTEQPAQTIEQELRQKLELPDLATRKLAKRLEAGLAKSEWTVGLHKMTSSRRPR
jgi:transcriptional regulator with XRE-family HTH domain